MKNLLTYLLLISPLSIFAGNGIGAGGTISGGTGTGGGGGGPITPWTSDINGAGFSLTNANTVTSSNFVGNGANITNLINVPTLWAGDPTNGIYPSTTGPLPVNANFQSLTVSTLNLVNPIPLTNTASTGSAGTVLMANGANGWMFGTVSNSILPWTIMASTNANGYISLAYSNPIDGSFLIYGSDPTAVGNAGLLNLYTAFGQGNGQGNVPLYPAALGGSTAFSGMSALGICSFAAGGYKNGALYNYDCSFNNSVVNGIVGKTNTLKFTTSDVPFNNATLTWNTNGYYTNTTSKLSLTNNGYVWYALFGTTNVYKTVTNNNNQVSTLFTDPYGIMQIGGSSQTSSNSWVPTGISGFTNYPTVIGGVSASSSGSVGFCGSRIFGPSNVGFNAGLTGVYKGIFGAGNFVSGYVNVYGDYNIAFAKPQSGVNSSINGTNCLIIAPGGQGVCNANAAGIIDMSGNTGAHITNTVNNSIIINCLNGVTLQNFLTITPLASGPAWAATQQTNSTFIWASNSLPATYYKSYFDVNSNRQDTFLF